MLNSLAQLLHGFGTALSPSGLLFTFIGVLLGQLIGALPGIGPAAGMALLLPVTFGMEPTFAVMMLAGIMYGGQYGGTLTSVLINVPGEASSVMTAVDGYQLAKKGEAGKALSVAGVGAVIVLVFAAPALSQFALNFSSPEYFLLASLGLTASAGFGSASLLKALLVTSFGLLIALIGTDPMAGTPRMTFGSANLLDGLDFLPVAIGLFGIGEVLASLNTPADAKIESMRLRDLWPRWSDWVSCRMAILRGGVIGFFIGVMPGAGAAIASLMAYFAERRFSKHPEKFGHGALDAIAAAESANNASAHGAFIPMLSLGIPGGPGTAVLLGALILAGIRPGPALMTEQATLVWGLIASMFVGNVMLLVLNLPLAPIFASVLRIPYVYIAPPILVLSLVGAYAQTLSLFTVGTAVFFGVLGYVMIRTGFPRAPLVLAMVLTPIMESSLRQSLMFSEGSLIIFVERPIALILLCAVVLSLVLPIFFSIRARRQLSAIAKEEVAHEQDNRRSRPYPVRRDHAPDERGSARARTPPARP
jgi:putative tricarboxylic transport membrane protein